MRNPAGIARAESRHRAVAGVLAAIILFATIFSVGISFFLFVSHSVQSADQASVARANNQLKAGQEMLLVTAGLAPGTDPGCPNCIWVRANNTGGVSSSIIDIYVTCLSNCGGSYQQGQLISNSAVSPASHFLKQPTDLNVTLPTTLGIGASTKYFSSCPRGECTADIAINRAAFAYSSSEYIVVSLLTSVGNVFSAQYPPPPNPSTTYVTVKSVSTQVVLTQVGGGPQLSLLMQATPTQTLSCIGCITLTATVYNQAPWTASGVSVTLNPPSSSGTASVSAYSPCSPASQDIVSGSSWSSTCLFSATTGAVGGFVSFSGHASGTLNGVLVTSADSLSNSVEVGGIASVTTQGAFAANFFFLRYSSCTQSSATQHSFVGPCVPNASPVTLSNLPSGSYLAGGSNYYTAWYIKITNIFNTTLPIMQYSYLFGDPDISGEYFNFLVGTNTSSTNGVYYPNYGANPPRLVGYPTDCSTVDSKNRPTDGNCIYVNPGQTVTLTFAACGYGATNWGWGGKQDASGFDSSSGCTSSSPSLSVPEGMSLGIVVSFAYKGSIYSQLMPFEGLALLRSTSTAVSCSPSPVTSSGSTTCTAAVTDTDGGSFSYSPTGTVTFSAAPTGYGSLSPASCTLASGSCSVTFFPNADSVGGVTIGASYGGDSYHMASSGSTTIMIVKPTSTSVSCVPSSLPVNTPTTCTVTVTDTSSTPYTPTGSVAFTSSPTSSGAFLPSACTLSGSGASATCTTQFTPSSGKEGSITITGTYNPDPSHATSTGSTSVTAIKRTSSISVSCSPTSIPVSVGTTCAATVTDTSSGTTITPTGTVTFAQSPTGSGTFSPTTCTLSSGSCSVTFTPSAGKEGTIGITATYGGDTDHSNSGPSSSFSVTATKRTTSIAVSCSPASIGFSAPTTCTATVTDTSSGTTITPTGTVTFSQSPTSSGTFSSTTCTLASGTCSVTFTPSAGTRGSVTISTTYGGDADHTGSGPSSATITVTLRTTSIAVSCSPASVAVNQATTCTATVTDTSGGTAITPTGTVTFAQSPTGSGTFSPTTCTLSSGSCSVTFTPSAGKEGTIGITATYGGDTSHLGSGPSSSFSVTATQRATSIAVSCSPASVAVNQATTCTATVTDTSSGTTITPTGTVTFSQSPTGSGTFSPTTCTLSSGSCSVTFTPSAGKEGTIGITATYGGDTDHSSSGPSSSFSVTATKRTSSISVSCSPASVPVSAGTTCTATVTDTSSGTVITPTGGTVTFAQSPTGSGTFSPTTCTLASGTCSVTFTPSAGKEGTIGITATYGGDTDHSSSGPSSSFSVTATKRTTSIAVSCSPASVAVNQATTCTATVTDTSSGTTITPTGTVTFSQSPTGSGTFSPTTCTLSSGSCSVTFTPSAGKEGTIGITATYGGDTDHSNSGPSSSFSVTATKRTTSIAVSCSPASVAVNQATTCTATVTDTSGGTAITPTGTVTFAQSPTGSGTFSPTTCTLASGTCSVTFTPSAGKEGTIGITATYGGDTDHSSSGPSSSFSLTVTQRSVTVTVSCSPTSVARGGNTATCTVTVTDSSSGTKITPTGTVSFAITSWTGNSGHRPTIGASCTLTSGTCTVTFTSGNNNSGSAGVATITATYNGDTDHSTNTGTTTETVT